MSGADLPSPLSVISEAGFTANHSTDSDEYKKYIGNTTQ